jgi:hypothetical protein
VRKPILLTLCATSVAGVGAGLWAHAVSLAGLDPQSVFQKLWIFQLILFFVLLPLAVRLAQRGVKTDPFGLPRREWRILAALLVYYTGHFYFFMAMAAEHLRASLTWQMFSAGWILLFMLSTFYYWTRFAEKRT